MRSQDIPAPHFSIYQAFPTFTCLVLFSIPGGPNINLLRTTQFILHPHL